MTAGPGKYNAQATAAREATAASTVILVVFGGRHGDGFSVQTEDPTMAAALPGILRTVAAAIEADINHG